MKKLGFVVIPALVAIVGCGLAHKPQTRATNQEAATQLGLKQATIHGNVVYTDTTGQAYVVANGSAIPVTVSEAFLTNHAGSKKSLGWWIH